jgi:hypothetical protein
VLNVCGAECAGCVLLKDCKGTCTEIQGKVFWTKYMGMEVCPIFKCVSDHKYKNCGDCTKIPCELWFSLKDPSSTDEQHRQSVSDRVKKLIIKKDHKSKTKEQKHSS